MIKTLEIILGYVEKPVAVGAAATSLTDQYNSDTSGFVLVNQSAQTGAAVAGVINSKADCGFYTLPQYQGEYACCDYSISKNYCSVQDRPEI